MKRIKECIDYSRKIANLLLELKLRLDKVIRERLYMEKSFIIKRYVEGCLCLGLDYLCASNPSGKSINLRAAIRERYCYITANGVSYVTIIVVITYY